MSYSKAFTISLLLHIVLAIVISLMPKIPLRTEMRRPEYVDLLENPVLNRRPHQPALDRKEFVRNVPVPPELLTKDKKPRRFASEEERTVIEETRAQETGLTANRSPDGSTPTPSLSMTSPPHPKTKSPLAKNQRLDFSPTTPLDRVKKEIMEDKDGIGGLRVSSGKKTPRLDATGEKRVAEADTRQASNADNSRPLVLPGFVGAERGISTFGNDIPDDVKVGSFTALNTDRHLYYSFYSRMEEQIRSRWETYVRAAIYEFQNGPVKLPAKDRWTTRLEVILDPDGRFERAMMSEGSGVRSFDQAPVQAFRDAAKFPNPPQEMVKDDGKIHIYYSFTIDIVPRYASGG